MSLFDTLFGKAKQIISSGKESLLEKKPVSPVETISSYSPTARQNNYGLGTIPKPPQAQWGVVVNDRPITPAPVANTTPQTTYQNPVDIIKNTAEGAKTVGKFAKDTAQSSMRSYAEIGALASGQKLTPRGKVQEAIYGTNKEINPTAIGVGLGVLDLFGGGRAGRAFSTLGKARKAVEVESVLQKEFKNLRNLADDDYKTLVKAVTEESDPKKIQEMVTNASKIVEETPVVKPADQDIATYMRGNIEKREAARGEQGFNAKLKGAFKEAEKKLVDFTMPIEDALATGKKKDKNFADFLTENPSKNVRNQIDRVLRSPNIASSFVRENGLQDVIKGVDDLDNFDEYLVARHAIDVDTRGITTGRDLKRDQEIVKRFGPQYEEQAKVITAYSHRLLDYITDTGLISKKVADTLKERYPNYVPLQRIYSELEESGGFGSKAVASLGRQSVVKNLVGSERAIESPIRSLLERTNQAFAQGEKNRAADLISSYAKVNGNPFQLRKVASTAEVAPDMGSITVLKDGKKEVWETSKEIADAAKALNIEQLNILGKLFALPTRVARAGITGINPSFVAANVVRDQVGSFIMADKGLKSSIAHPINFLKSFWGAVGHGELYDEWVRAGGGGTSFDMGRQQIAQTVDRIRSQRSVPSRIAFTVRHPSQLLRAVEDIIGRSEELTRLQQYKGHRDDAIARGLSKEEAEAAGAAASRENSTNFARRGEWGTVLNSAFLYLNAGIQGSRLLIRNLKNKPVKTSAKIASTLLFPAATITYWNMSDPERKRAYDDIQDYEKENNLVIVPPNPTQDESGRWNVIKIPLPPGVGQFTNLVRRPIEQSQGMDPVRFSEIASALSKTVSPIDLTNPLASLTPQALKPTLQAATNYDLFTQKPIVYQSESQLPTNEQVRPNTSGTAAKIADVIGASPIKVDKFITDTGGGVAKNVLNTLDRVFTPEQVGGTSVTESISRRFSSAAGNDTSQQAESEVYSALDAQDAENASRRKKAENIVAGLNDMSGDERKATLLELAKTDRALFDKVMDVKKEEAKGLSDEQSAMIRLGIDNGARAEFIYKKLEDMDNAEAKAYLVDLRKKKILTDEVFSQLTKLKEGGKI